MKIKNDIQEAGESGNIWKLVKRIKGTCVNANLSFFGRSGVKYDVLGKATAVDVYLEGQFMPNNSDDQFREHYKQSDEEYNISVIQILTHVLDQ